MDEPVGTTGIERSGVVAALLGAIIPGLGHGYLGRWWRAAAMAIPIVLIPLVGLFAAQARLSDVLATLATPEALRVVLITNVAIIIWRIIAVADPYRISRRARTVWTTTTVVLLAFLVAVPHVIVAKYSLDASSALEQVFVSDDPAAVQALVDKHVEAYEFESVPDPVTVRIHRDPDQRNELRFVERPGGQLPAAVLYGWKGVPQRVSDEVGAEWFGTGRITVLLVGGDGGAGRRGNRADSIMVASLEPATGKAAVFGIPRNMTQIALPAEWSTAFVDLEQRLTPWEERRKWTDDNGDGQPDQFVPCHCFPDQINALYPYTRGWTDTYPDEPDPGMAALRDTLEIMLDLKIDYYAMVNMSGFVSLVNALGGVRTYVIGHVTTEVSPAREGEDWISVDLNGGWNRLNGHEALAYVRERKTVSDYTRMKRQRCMLKAIAAQADPLTIATRFSRIARAVGSSVRTNIPIEELPTFIRYAASLDFSDIETVGFVPPFYTPEVDHRGKPTPDLDRIREMVRLTLNADTETEFATGGDSECRV